MTSKVTTRRRLSRYQVASGDGPIDRIKIGCVFGMLKGTYWITAAALGRRKADLDFPCIVSNRYRFAFCGIPKVATGSIRAALLSSSEIAAVAINRNAAALAAEGSPYQFHYKFSFVRNPWSRVASCYRNKIMLQSETVLGQLSIIAKHPGLSPGLPFDAFVEWLCSDEGSDQCADRHWMSQYYLLSEGTGRIVCDFVGRLENFEADFKAVCMELSLPPVALPHVHRSSYSQEPHSYRELFNERTRKLIGRRYERDVDTFGYTF